MAERVLVVDDEAQITRVLRTALSAQGYDVRAANDPEEALRLFEDWSPDLIVTDLMMPGMSGVELCRRVRSKAATPIIVLSVRDQERSKVEALDAGADGGCAHRHRRLYCGCLRSHRNRPRQEPAPHSDRVRSAALHGTQCGQGPHPSRLADGGMGRPVGAPAGVSARLHRPASPQTRSRRSAAIYPDRALGRLSLPARRRPRIGKTAT